MKNIQKKFVFLKRDLIVPPGVLLEKGSVGIVRNENINNASIFFITLWKEINISTIDYLSIDVNKTGDKYHQKICNVCHKLKKTIDFAKNQNGKNNRTVRRPSCNNCRVEMDGKNLSSSEKAKWVKEKPVFEPFECPICKKRTIAGVTCKVVLEHDHRTGKAGGWVCDSCNTGLGRFKDNIKILENAKKYLSSAYQP